MCKQMKNFKIFTFVITLQLLFVEQQQQVYGNPLVNELNIKNSDLKEGGAENELNDLISANGKMQIDPIGGHHDDDDENDLEFNLGQDKSLKYDVEILESRNIKKENIEVEEQFRGPGLNVNTNEFYNQNIEVQGDNEPPFTLNDSHILLTILLVVVAVGSIGVYTVLVLWRNHLERRYGMSELLVNSDDGLYVQASPVSIHSSQYIRPQT